MSESLSSTFAGRQAQAQAQGTGLWGMGWAWDVGEGMWGIPTLSGEALLFLHMGEVTHGTVTLLTFTTFTRCHLKRNKWYNRVETL